MKIIDNILDKYYSRKLIEITLSHIRTHFSQAVSINYDKVLGEWTLDVLLEGEEDFTLSYIAFRRQNAVIVLNRLLATGWTNLDKDFLNRKKRIERAKKEEHAEFI